MASLTLAGVRKSYRKGVEIVRGIDLHIADGELVSLVGASGSGKSTLLNLIAGLETPTPKTSTSSTSRACGNRA